MFENPRRGRQARNFTTNVPKIVVLKSSSEQIFSLMYVGGNRCSEICSVNFINITTGCPVSLISCAISLIKTLFLHEISKMCFLLYQVPVFRSSAQLSASPLCCCCCCCCCFFLSHSVAVAVLR